METLIVGERGQITIPSDLRKKYNIKSKQPVILEERNGELVIIPARAIPLNKLKQSVRTFDDDFVKELIEEDILENNEKLKIMNKWKG
ncbi:MAG: AbrB/MazE/SpoVT family DNA-binding domain-containing protein [Deltaproteobacteria bacterium]|nr:AbrB/MazE/SpoVT family DNA-binding domain-containing protein [Deltaproteobacteria bacterium]